MEKRGAVGKGGKEEKMEEEREGKGKKRRGKMSRKSFFAALSKAKRGDETHKNVNHSEFYQTERKRERKRKSSEVIYLGDLLSLFVSLSLFSLYRSALTYVSSVLCWLSITAARLASVEKTPCRSRAEMRKARRLLDRQRHARL